MARPKLSPVQWGTVLGVAFGLFFRFYATITHHFDGSPVTHGARTTVGVMTFSFIFLVPAGIGALAVSRVPVTSLKLRDMLLAPWLPMLACLGMTALLGWEGLICILMGIPVFLFMASLGGLVMGWAMKARGTQQSTVLLSVLVLAPSVLIPIESRFPGPERKEVVNTSIPIHASPETVWRNIIRVPAIQPGEHSPTWFHRIGFPRPIEASLSADGVGGVRHASFEGQLVFVETVQEWHPLESLAFSIHVSPETIPPSTLDEHVTIGGPFFDVLDGRYWIERRGIEDVVLHLSSTHRLSTRFNLYAGLWSRFVMSDIQRYILEVIRARCEDRQGAGRI